MDELASFQGALAGQIEAEPRFPARAFALRIATFWEHTRPDESECVHSSDPQMARLDR